MDQPAPPPKIEGQRRKIAALLVLAMLLAAAMVAAIATQQRLFGASARLYFLADDVTGLAPGTTVRTSGVRIGKVEDIELQADQKVKVTLAIGEEHFARLRADAHATMVREQLRPASIELRMGRGNQPFAAADPRVSFTRRGTLNEVADDMRNRIAPILDDVRQLTGVARERKGEIDGILKNAHQISTAMAGTATELQALSRELRARANAVAGRTETALAEGNRTIVRLGGLVGNAEKGLDTVTTRLPGLLDKTTGMLEKTDQMLGQMDGILRDARAISSAAATQVPTVLRQVPPLVDESREMLQGVRQSWPVRTLLPPPPPLLLPIDSHDPAALASLPR
jgi:phospholipid/cholesterol/gamma-HCH transport system substrate-binding protein